MKSIILILAFLSMTVSTHALVINEVMSNPLGDDSGREWIEIYNNSESSVDLTTLTISVKGGTFVPITPVSGGVTLAPHGYAIIGSTVSLTTRFTQDYPSYNGPLLKSAISLVNTGVTSLEIKMSGSVADTLSSYTAAKEGNTYSLLNGTFAAGAPTPGEENKTVISEEVLPTTTDPSGTQSTLPRSSSPSADIVLYLPTEKTVVAGAPSLFLVSSMTHAGKGINDMVYTWAFGDGGQSTGSSTLYRYLYPGRYVAQVEGTNGLIAGTGRMIVRVVSPDILLSSIGSGKYGNYIDLTNPSAYDLDISSWKILIDGAPFSFPKNTLLAHGVTRFTGVAMGFASTTVSSSTLIKLLFPNMDEVLRVTQGGESNPSTFEKKIVQITLVPGVNLSTRQPPLSKSILIRATSSKAVSTITTTTSNMVSKTTNKDVRLATWIKSLFGR